MLEAAETTIRSGARFLVSAVLAAALALPAFPLGEALPAYAESSTVPLDMTAADPSLFDEALVAESLEPSGADPLETQCGNCMEESESATEEVMQREEEAERRVQEALAQAEELTIEDVLEAEREAAEVAEATAGLEPADEGTFAARSSMRDRASFTSRLAAVASALASEIASFGASDAASNTAYSSKLALEDIVSVTAYANESRTGKASLNSIWLGYAHLPQYGSFDPANQTVLVRSYRMPSFFAEVVDGHDEDGQFYLTVKLPAATDEEPCYVDLHYGKVQSAYAYPKAARSITDASFLASLADIAGYDQARDNAYLNASKLAPFASHEDIVKSGNRMPANSALATKTINASWPVHEEEGMNVSLMEGDEERIVRSMVTYTDGTSETFDMTYLGSAQSVASYVMEGTDVLYQPDFWVIGGDAKKGVERLADFIRSKTWNDFFGAYMKTMAASKNVTIHRSVRDHFDDDMHDNAEEVAANLLSNIEEWNPTAAHTNTFAGIMHEAETALPDESFEASGVQVKLYNLLFLYTYWERFLNFDVGGNEQVGFRKDANAFLTMAFRGEAIRSGCSLVALTPTVRATRMLGFSNVDKLASSVSLSLAPATGISSPTAFVEFMVRRLSGYVDCADWFADYMSSIAFYREYEPPAIEGVSDAGQLTWRGWHQVKRYPDMALFWLTLKPGSQYFASTSMLIATGATGIYAKDAVLDEATRSYYKGRIDAIFEPASRYAATVASIVGLERPNSLCVIAFDQKASKYDGGTSWMEREMLSGKKLSQDPYHKDFTDPLGIFISSGQGAAAMTINSSLQIKRIFFLAYTSLGCGWSYYWSHEMAHAIDNTVFLNGDRRGINNTEDFTDGLLTQSHGQMSYVMNLSYDYDASADTLSNLTRERIVGKENLDDFYHKLYGTIDLMDYAALQAFLRLDKEEQNAVASQAWFDGQNGTSTPDTGATATRLCARNRILNDYDGTTATMPVNASVFIDGTRKFETLEEVYDNQLFLRPGISETSDTTWVWANYVSDDLRGMWWFPIHCNGNRPDSRSFKLQMYRMLGSDGFDAFANYGRSGGNDLSKLQDITGYESYKAWQMAKWEALEAKTDDLSFIGFDELVDKFEEALKGDAEAHDRNLARTHSLRVRMLYLMKRLTDDFRADIYDSAVPTVEVRTAADLLAIAENPRGSYVLANDIDLSGLQVESGKALVDAVFCGKLDGQGHRIWSSANDIVPAVFAGAKQAYVKDLTVCGVTSQVIAPSVVNCELENVGFTLFERDVLTVEDFVGIGDDLKLGISTFHLKSDLDFTEWSEANAAAEAGQRKSAVVTQLVNGASDAYKVFNGNGHTISGLSGASLFDRLCFAEVNDLTIRDSRNIQDAASGTYVALLAKRTYESRFSDLYFENVSLQGRAWIGFVSGDDGFANAAGRDTRDGGSRFERIQVNDASVVVGTSTSSNTAYGGFVSGRLCQSSLTDVYVQGRLATFGTSCGGVTGAIHKSAVLERCVSNVSLSLSQASSALKNGCLVGDIEADNYDESATSISACFGLGDPAPSRSNPGARLAYYTAAGAAKAFHDCFENVSLRYGSTLVSDAEADVDYIRTAYLVWQDSVAEYPGDPACIPLLRNDVGFYTALGFDESVWEFDPTIKLGYPTLRFEGDRSTFYDHDMSFSIDYEQEALCFTGEDFDPTKTQLHNLPYRTGSGSSSNAWGGVDFDAMPVFVSRIIGDDGRVDLSEAIEYEGFKNGEVERKGTRTISFLQKSSLYQIDGFEMALELPPRPDMDCADRIRGVRASSTGMGAIHFASIGIYDASELEYRAVADSGADGSDTEAAAQDAGEWTRISSAITPVPPGTYEVRIAATDSSFASYPTTVEVAEHDPSLTHHPLVLDPNGGSWIEGYEPPNEYDSEVDLVLPTAAQIARTGYTFGGWYDNAELSGAPVERIEAGETDPIALYARWTANTYAVGLNLNGGALQSANDDVTHYTTGIGATLPTPLRAHHTFLGWFDNVGCAGEPVAAILPTDAGDKRFWAKWEAIAYRVTLHAQEGSFAEGVADSFTYEAGAGVVLPGAKELSCTGHAFKGWFGNKDCTGAAVEVISATDAGDKELWAKWTPEAYTVALHMNGGKVVVGQHDVISYTYGERAELPQLERGGYEFDGWFDNADLSGEAVSAIAEGEVGERSFWAKWTPIAYTIGYNLGSDAQGEMPPVIDLEAYGSYTTGEAYPLPDASVMTWSDHVFAGWYDNAGFAGSPLTELPAGTYGDIMLYARWAGNACVLLFDAGGGEFIAEPKTVYDFDVDGVRPGDTVTLPGSTDITRRGYAFEGWYDNAELSGSPVKSVTLAPQSISLHAKWRAVDYRVTYVLNEGAWVEGYEPPMVYTVESDEVELPTAAEVMREGHSFEGWYDNAELSGEPVTAIDGSAAEDKTFYAAWRSDAVELPDLEIVSLSIEGVGEEPIVWDETGYARIMLPRDKMPESAEDFAITVPEGAYVHSITKRERLLVRSLTLALRAAASLEEASIETDTWDIILRAIADPDYEKRYTLDIVPSTEDEVDPSPKPPEEEEPPVVPPTEEEPPVIPPAEDDPSVPPTEDDPSTPIPPTDTDAPAPPSDEQQPPIGGGDGSGSPDQDGNNGGDGSDGTLGSGIGGGSAGGSGPAGNAGSAGSTNLAATGASSGAQAVTASGKDSALIRTGDDLAAMLALLGVVFLVSGVLVLLRSRRLSER